MNVGYIYKVILWQNRTLNCAINFGKLPMNEQRVHIRFVQLKPVLARFDRLAYMVCANRHTNNNSMYWKKITIVPTFGDT